MKNSYSVLGINMDASKDEILNAFANKILNAHGKEKDEIMNAYSMIINKSVADKKDDGYDFDFELEPERIYLENMERLYNTNNQSEINIIELKNKIELLKAKKNMFETEKNIKTYKIRKLNSYIDSLNTIYHSLVPKEENYEPIMKAEVNDLDARDLVIHKDSLEYKKTLSKGVLKLQKNVLGGKMYV